MIKLKNVTVRYGDFTALNLQGEYEIKSCDFVGIIGANGAGKSTLVKVLTDQVRYTGAVEKPSEIAVHLQENSYPDVVNCQTILEGLLKTSYKHNHKLQELVRFFDFEKNLKKKYANLSGGHKQRLTLIMVLYQDTPVTCFDEMTTGLDFETRNKLMKKISDWYSEKSAALLFITHYFDELEKLANKLLIIDQGQVVDFGDITYLFKKYVGYSAIILEDISGIDINQYKLLKSEKGSYYAISCDSQKAQQSFAESLVKLGKKFIISDKSIELIYSNAVHNNRN
ncbi:MAG: ATP-binding cassette domain-containing protein [Streptococcaceae bacterium]|jgi:ABC-2 type transport system ATP-binding protein|nr:ATP-binding cassette domain-containing protein [Streptococcaceae bacterium]